jgi:hypothetical protein
LKKFILWDECFSIFQDFWDSAEKWMDLRHVLGEPFDVEPTILYDKKKHQRKTWPPAEQCLMDLCA